MQTPFKMNELKKKDIAYNTIKENLLKGFYKETESLSEGYLVKTLNMSRTPIREALQKIQNENLIEISPNRGISIHVLTLKEINDLINLRTAIECYSLDLIFEKISNKEIKEMKNNLNEQIKTHKQRDTLNFTNLDIDFHESFLQLTKNTLFIENMKNIRERTLLHANNIFDQYPERVSLSIDEHFHIIEKIEEKKKDEAIKLLKEHLLNGKERMIY
ncbi:GntR family transcriptional regulator [Halobacillus litoralis]|uniref:GntR family transcriptional regulator n=1 Tax=Halobacillus litoralis TaxID=45668 RepID=UPI00249044B2|nr:GntR family transcriptional regulator [Halobacillus litoralis]